MLFRALIVSLGYLWSVKDTITAMSNSLWSTLFSFTSRLSKENKRKEEIYLSRTVLLLTFTFSLISELSRGFAAMPVWSFLLVLTSFVFNAIFPFHFVHYHPWSNMHACTFFFNERLVIHPAIHPFVVHLLYHLSTFLSNLNAGHV